MSLVDIFGLIFLGAAVLWGLLGVLSRPVFSCEQVLHNLAAGGQDDERPRGSVSDKAARIEIPPNLASCWSSREVLLSCGQGHLKRPACAGGVLPLLGMLGASLAYLVFFPASAGGLTAGGMSGLALGYLIQRRLVLQRERGYVRRVEFFLPIVMERLVMAVQAGLDIIPALKAIGGLDGRAATEPALEEERSCSEERDPVTQLLGVVCALTEAGLSFEQSLREVASAINSSPLRHAFIHLAIAQREGGELVMPLRELSDATQLYYQESVEEEIAKLPVKATIPLLCTFAGLIICFITSPLVQIIHMTAKAAPH